MKNVPQVCRNISYRSAAADLPHSSLFTGCVELKMRQLFVYTAYVTRLHPPHPPIVWRFPLLETCLLWGRLFSYQPQLLLTIHRLWQSYINTTRSKNRIVTFCTASYVQRESGWFGSFTSFESWNSPNNFENLILVCLSWVLTFRKLWLWTLKSPVMWACGFGRYSYHSLEKVNFLYSTCYFDVGGSKFLSNADLHVTQYRISH